MAAAAARRLLGVPTPPPRVASLPGIAGPLGGTDSVGSDLGGDVATVTAAPPAATPAVPAGDVAGAAARGTFLVSNRLPYKVAADGTLTRSDGGLVSALLPVHRDGASWWVGQGGFDASLRDAMAAARIVDVAVPAAVAAAHYNGASNASLWPLSHYLEASFDAAEWAAYRDVNAAFADAVAARAAPGDVVWVHDYQLMLLPAMLRARAPALRIGYFHHIPFPAPEVFRTHPARDELLAGLLGADVVGFHTLEYAAAFAAAATRLAGYECVAEELYVGDRVVRVVAAPLGLDVAALAAAAATPAYAAAAAELAATVTGRVLLGVDRLDITKGLLQRLAAYEKLLRRRPDLAGAVTFIQLCVPSRTGVRAYADLRDAVELAVGRINGELGRPGWTPVQYLFQTRPLPQLAALYARADVAVVTPLRDGLNLVCKEYCAMHGDGSGVLILSEFAGAAEEMGEALVVNPNDIDAVAAAYERALDMDAGERAERMRTLHARVTATDNRAWAATFLAAVVAQAARNAAFASREIDAPAAAALAAPLHAALAAAAGAVAGSGSGDDTTGAAVGAAAGAAGATAPPPPLLPLVVIDLDTFLPTAYRTTSATAAGVAFVVAAAAPATVVLVSSLTHERLGAICPPQAAVWLVAERGACIRDAAGVWTHMAPGAPLEPHRSGLRHILASRARILPRARLDERAAYMSLTVGGGTSELAGTIRDTVHAVDASLAHSSWCCTRTKFGAAVTNSQCNVGAGVAHVASLARYPPAAPLVIVGDAFSDITLWRGPAGSGSLAPATLSIAVGTPVSLARFVVPTAADLLALLTTIVAPPPAQRPAASGDARAPAATTSP